MLVSLAIVALLGHVCALPTHAHAESGTSAAAHHETPGSHEPSDSAGSLHAASCEAAVGTATQLSAPAMAVVDHRSESPVSRGSVRAAAHVASPRSESPPLFLLHAALLI